MENPSRATSPSPEPGHGAEYHERGVIADTFELAQPGALELLRSEMPEFLAEVAANREAGLHRVPYRRSPGIDAIAQDERIAALVREVLGADERWVMWGANIQTGTPNEAGAWHVDIESFRWPSITVVVGVDGCEASNATRCLPYSHRFENAPAVLPDRSDDDAVMAYARKVDPRCGGPEAPVGFADGRFYVFNARAWHTGETATSRDRTVLFLHYHSASAKRIPLMKSYEDKTWFNEPAPFLAGPEPDPLRPQAVNAELEDTPSAWRQRLRRTVRGVRSRT